MSRSRRKFLALMMSGLALSSLAAACGAPGVDGEGSSEALADRPANQPEKVRITLVSYAVTQAAYEAIIPMFAKQWREQTGQEVEVEQSYGASGSQARAVIDGLEADVVALALALDTLAIEEAGLIEPGWETKLPNESIVHKSVVALVPRDDSVAVEGWADLADDSIRVVTANPKTSGGARWNFLALWGAITQAGGSEAEAEAYVTQVFQNVPVLPKNARESSDAFYQQGQGNVLLNYENEVILANQQGKDLAYVIPTDYNISIDSPVAVVDAYVDRKGTREVAEAFVQFLFTPEAQQEFARVGFRPIDDEVAKEFGDQFPPIQNLFTVRDFKGWDVIQDSFFADGAIFDQILQKVGKSDL